MERHPVRRPWLQLQHPSKLMDVRRPKARSPARDTSCTKSSLDPVSDPEVTLPACPFVHSHPKMRDELVHDPYKLRATQPVEPLPHSLHHHESDAPKRHTYELLNSHHSNDQTRVSLSRQNHHSTTHRRRPCGRLAMRLERQPAAMAAPLPSQACAHVWSELH